MIIPDTWSIKRVTRLALDIYDMAHLLGHCFDQDEWHNQFARRNQLASRDWKWRWMMCELRDAQIQFTALHWNGAYPSLMTFPSRKYMFDVADALIGSAEFGPDIEEPYGTNGNALRRIANLKKNRHQERGVA